MRRGGTVVGMTCLLLVGCSDAGTDPQAAPSGFEVSELHREWMAVDLANVESDLLDDVFADFWVTDAERDAGREDYRRCLESWPTELSVSFDDEGGSSVGPVPSGTEEAEEFDRFTTECAKTFTTIEKYYLELRANPDGLTYVQAIRACFAAEGVPDGAELNDKEFEELVLNDGGEMYEPESDAGKECVRHPFRGGY